MEALEAPAIHVMYRRGARQSARVRAFIEFMVETFANLEAARERSGQRKFDRYPCRHGSQPSGAAHAACALDD